MWKNNNLAPNVRSGVPESLQRDEQTIFTYVFAVHPRGGGTHSSASAREDREHNSRRVPWLVKVAQSNLSLDEANKLLDALQPAEPSEPAAEEKPKKKGKKKAKKQPEDKIRKRVEKNVANEIHQIEEKVDRELSELLDEDEGIDAEALAILIPEVPEPTEEPVTQVHPFATPVFLAPEAVEEDLEVEASVSDEDEQDSGDADDTSEDGDGAPSKRKRRGRRGKGRGRGAEAEQTEDEDVPEGPVGIKGSPRLEAQRRRRTERREEERKKRHVVSEAEFLARRESVDRTMVVRERQRNDHPGLVTQVGVLEDDLLVEHFVTSESQSSLVGNIYLGRVQNVLPSMEAAFIDIGKGRNGVLYAGEVDWRARGLGGRGRKIEQALKSGDQVLVQVTKDPVGHKGARLTTQISLAGRYLVYVPSGRATGISRKLPENERKRLKSIVKDVVPKALTKPKLPPTCAACTTHGSKSSSALTRRKTAKAPSPSPCTKNQTCWSKSYVTCSTKTSLTWWWKANAPGTPCTPTCNPSRPTSSTA